MTRHNFVGDDGAKLSLIYSIRWVKVICNFFFAPFIVVYAIFQSIFCIVHEDNGNEFIDSSNCIRK